jgi:DNA polymerase III subunit alpha
MAEAAPRRFAHLHQHTAYSLLDGAARIEDLVAWVKQVTPDEPALAMTDHGNMHGAIEFFKQASAAGVKPILGIEAYVTAGSRFDKRRPEGNLDGGYYHLTLLAKNLEGYKNLCKLSSRSWLEGFYMKPRVDLELLEEHAAGVIALSGCLGAQIPRTLLDVGEDAGRAVFERYLSIYRDDFFVELQNHGLADQARLNPMLQRLADEFGVATVATNDGHYVRKEDASAHEALLAIQTKTVLSDPDRFRFPCDEFYVKTPEEMAKAIPESDFPGAVERTMEVAARCTLELPIGDRRVYQMPELPLPEGRTLAEQLRVQTYAGLLERYGEQIDEAFLRAYLGAAEGAPATGAWLDRDELLLRLARHGEASRQPLQRGQTYGAYEYAHLEAFAAARGAAARAETARAGARAEPSRAAAAPADAAGDDGAAADTALTILQRAEFELGVIIAMGFPDYFLIVADFIGWARRQGIAVGPGRGSGAGSIVAYALRITNIDPLAYDLLFERFLNPERVSMPDFDIDFSDTRRGEVIEYVRERYGDDKVAHIATFGTLASRAAIKDAARVLEAQFAEADRISKLVPLHYGRSVSIEQALEEVPELRALYEGGAQPYVDVAKSLQGLTRHASVHAAGVIIARDPVQELAPVFRSGDGPVVCQYDMGSVEELGFLKMDFLGLRTLSFVEATLRIVQQTYGETLDPDAFPLDDRAVFELLSRGDAAGVFQFESPGMVDTLKKLKPRRIQDLIAVSALFRPGPMENIPTYIRRHHGLEAVTWEDFPTAGEAHLAPILAETYGIPVYQEQIMQIAQRVAGYSLGEADLLRRAMGKKKLAEMEQQRIVFERGAQARGIPADEANRIFDLLEKFANYGFNKSHSAAYTLISYQTAYLKAHYPVAFAAALLTVERADSDKVAEYVADARHLGIEVLPPDVNESGGDFTPVGEVIRFGLHGVKNVGDAAVGHLLAERERGGRFVSLFDLCRRVDTQLLNKRALESLVKAGACDRFGDRASLLAALEGAMRWGAAQREQAAGGQLGLFAAEVLPEPTVVAVEAFTPLERLRLEKEALGLYLSSHPMASYPGLAEAATVPVAGVEDWFGQRRSELPGGGRLKLVLAGLLQNVTKRPTRKGTMMARFEIADESGAREVVAFSRAFEEMSPLLENDAPVVLVTEASEDGDAVRLVADRLMRWDRRDVTAVPELAVLSFDVSHLGEHQLLDLRSRLDEHAGSAPVQLRVRGPEGIVHYAVDGARVDPGALATIRDACPWLEATLTLDAEALTRERAGNGRGNGYGNGRGNGRGFRGSAGSQPADELPF